MSYRLADKGLSSNIFLVYGLLPVLPVITEVPSSTPEGSPFLLGVRFIVLCKVVFNLGLMPSLTLSEPLFVD